MSECLNVSPGPALYAYALCPALYALCPMPYALCPRPYALRSTPYAFNHSHVCQNNCHVGFILQLMSLVFLFLFQGAHVIVAQPVKPDEGS